MVHLLSPGDSCCGPSEPTWACCLPGNTGECENLTEQQCIDRGGIWHENVRCSANPCEVCTREFRLYTNGPNSAIDPDGYPIVVGGNVVDFTEYPNWASNLPSVCFEGLNEWNETRSGITVTLEGVSYRMEVRVNGTTVSIDFFYTVPTCDGPEERSAGATSFQYSCDDDELRHIFDLQIEGVTFPAEIIIGDLQPSIEAVDHEPDCFVCARELVTIKDEFFGSAYAPNGWQLCDNHVPYRGLEIYQHSPWPSINGGDLFTSFPNDDFRELPLGVLFPEQSGGFFSAPTLARAVVVDYVTKEGEISLSTSTIDFSATPDLVGVIFRYIPQSITPVTLNGDVCVLDSDETERLIGQVTVTFDVWSIDQTNSSNPDVFRGTTTQTFDVCYNVIYDISGSRIVVG